MSTINAGRVTFVSKGVYNDSTQYYKFDLVTYNGSSYIAKENTLGNIPTNDTYWHLIAEKGQQGIQGIQGETGNGIATIQKTSTSGLIDTYTITYTDGNMSTFSITNGKDGKDGEVSQEQLDETNSHLDHLSKVSNLFGKITGTGTSITLNDTSNTIMKLNLNTTTSSQENVPTPSSPQTIHTITGNNDIKINNKNLLKITTFSDDTTTKTINGITATIKDGKIHISGTSSARAVFNLKKNDFTVSNNFYYYCNSISSVARLELLCKVDGATKYLNSFSAANFQNAITSFEYTSLYVVVENGQTVNHTFTPMVVEGSTLSQYEPYKQQTYPINLGDIEVCKIGDYEDILFKNTLNSEYYNSSLELNKWYKLNAIGKYQITGQESSSILYWNTGVSGMRLVLSDALDTIANLPMFCNRFKTITTAPTESDINYVRLNRIIESGYLGFWFGNLNIDGVTNESTFKTWASTNDIILYYPLKENTYTLLNDTLQTQLDNLQYALAYDTQTNISQTNNDLPFIISAETYKEINLSDYVKNTDYATRLVGGVIKVDNYYDISLDSGGALRSNTVSYNDYLTENNNIFISKGTLENVITGKELDLKQLSTFDSTKTQVLKNINGTLTWVDE